MQIHASYSFGLVRIVVWEEKGRTLYSLLNLQVARCYFHFSFSLSLALFFRWALSARTRSFARSRARLVTSYLFMLCEIRLEIRPFPGEWSRNTYKKQQQARQPGSCCSALRSFTRSMPGADSVERVKKTCRANKWADILESIRFFQ